MNAPSPNPRHLDTQTLCREGRTLSGDCPVLQMSRLATSLEGSAPDTALVVFSAVGSQVPVTGGDPELWLHLQARATVPLQCQRCLQALPQELAVDRRFRFARTEDEAERLDEELEDDVLVLQPRMDLFELLEDELILALPLVPRHEGTCPQPLPQPDVGLPAEAAAPHPFAALAAL